MREWRGQEWEGQGANSRIVYCCCLVRIKEAEPMPTLPSGTVTFLFTDIEGSTRLWEEKPKAMRVALARHDGLLREAIEANSGIICRLRLR